MSTEFGPCPCGGYFSSAYTGHDFKCRSCGFGFTRREAEVGGWDNLRDRFWDHQDALASASLARCPRRPPSDHDHVLMTIGGSTCPQS